MKWRIIEVSDEEATDDDLTNGELLALSVAAINVASRTGYDTYDSAWKKLRQPVKVALDGDDVEIQP